MAARCGVACDIVSRAVHFVREAEPTHFLCGLSVSGLFLPRPQEWRTGRERWFVTCHQVLARKLLQTAAVGED